MVRTSPRKLCSDRDCLALVANAVETMTRAREAARANLRRTVVDYVENHARLPDRINDAGPARQTIAQLVWNRLELDAYQILREWRRRMLYRQDQAPFHTMLRTVAWYVAIEYLHHAEASSGRAARVGEETSG